MSNEDNGDPLEDPLELHNFIINVERLIYKSWNVPMIWDVFSKEYETNKKKVECHLEAKCGILNDNFCSFVSLIKLQ